MYLEILGTLSPVKFPPFPEAAWGELLRPFKRRPAVNPTGITGVSTGEER